MMMLHRLVTTAASRTVRSAVRPRLLSTATTAGSSSQHAARNSSAFLLTATGAAAGIATLAATIDENQRHRLRDIPALCHCQVPCGIFDDPARVKLLEEYAATIRKAVVQINNLAGESPEPQDFNQAARWVAVKEDAASQIIDIVATYMLCQRVKKANFATREKYLHALELHHIVMQACMLSKQTVSATTCDALDKAIDSLGKMYTAAN